MRAKRRADTVTYKSGYPWVAGIFGLIGALFATAIVYNAWAGSGSIAAKLVMTALGGGAFAAAVYCARAPFTGVIVEAGAPDFIVRNALTSRVVKWADVRRFEIGPAQVGERAYVVLRNGERIVAAGLSSPAYRAGERSLMCAPVAELNRLVEQHQDSPSSGDAPIRAGSGELGSGG
jgi:hypothetical protein